MTEPVTIILPELPPPLSACFVNAKGPGRVNAKGPGRVKSVRYKAWIKMCEYTSVSLRNCPLIPGPVEVDYEFARPDNRCRDLGNLEKAISDLLVRMNIIDDDSMIQDLRLRWGGEAPVTIIVTPLTGSLMA